MARLRTKEPVPTETIETEQGDDLRVELEDLLRGKPEDKYTLLPVGKSATNQTVKATGVFSDDGKQELCEKLI